MNDAVFREYATHIRCCGSWAPRSIGLLAIPNSCPSYLECGDDPAKTSVPRD